MQGFLTALLQCSVSMALLTLVYAAVMPLISRRYAAKWSYIVWILIAAGWIFPFRPRIDLSIPHVQLADIPVTLMQSTINAIPSMAAGIVQTRATISLWWVIAAIWGLGVVSIILYHAQRHYRFMKMVHKWSKPVTDLKHLEILDILGSELGVKRHIGLNVCDSITSPMLVGFFRPVILLPPIKFTQKELYLILKHEYIHFKRLDHWNKAMILAATVLHWFNPVVYLMAKMAAEQCEISCDALVLKNANFQQRLQYGETIIGVVRNGARLQTALTTNFYGGKKGMENRISSIIYIRRKKNGVLILCMALVGIILTGATLTAAANSEDSKESNTTKVVEELQNRHSDQNDNEKEVILLKMLLRDRYIDNVDDLQVSNANESVTWSHNSDSNNDEEITKLKELLRDRYIDNDKAK